MFNVTLRLLVVLSIFASIPGLAADAAPETEDDKVLYAIGLGIARSLANFELTEKQLGFLESGLSDGALGRKPKVDLQEYQSKINAFVQERSNQAAEKEKEASRKFLEEAAKATGATKTESGLIYTEIKPGEGKSPTATDTVKVHYHGTLRDGTVFDSSVERGTPATFPLNRVIPCWTEGVQRMKPGGKAKLICPSAIAYGDRGSPPKILPGAALVFEVELIAIEAPAPAAAPAAPDKEKK